MDINLFDIVIPVGPNDINIINKQVEYTKKNVIGYRNIYIISYDPTIFVEGCIIINENIFPFSKKDVENYLGKESRQNWYIQQLFKLYSCFIIPDILERILIIDSDIFFSKPIEFDNGNEICLYNPSEEYHLPYFDHMKKLHPNLYKKNIKLSGISHHMIFEKKYLKKLFDEVEEYHKELFWIAFLKCIIEYNTSGASEYEIYFNYMLINFPEKIRIRNLSIQNIYCIKDIDNYNYDIISCHWHSRQ